MRFSDQEIALAHQLRERGLDWQPRAGHFVYDLTGFCKRDSPFQEKVYFILNYDYFMHMVGGVETVKRIMLWLPAWHDAREILRELEVPDAAVASLLHDRQAIRNGDELQTLYELISRRLEASKQESLQGADAASARSGQG